MRFTDIDLQSSDILWFGVDTKGNLAAFFSGGGFSVPEFVCQSMEETELLEEYFLNTLEASTEAILCVEEKDNSLMRDCKLLSAKGIYCYDVSEKDGIDYEMISCPEVAITIRVLSSEVAGIMESHIMEGSFSEGKEVVIG